MVPKVGLGNMLRNVVRGEAIEELKTQSQHIYQIKKIMFEDENLDESQNKQITCKLY